MALKWLRNQQFIAVWQFNDAIIRHAFVGLKVLYVVAFRLIARDDEVAYGNVAADVVR